MSNHIFLVPADKEGLEFVRLARKFIDPEYTIQAYRSSLKSGKHGVFIGSKYLSHLSKHLKAHDIVIPIWFSNLMLKTLGDLRLKDLMFELQEEIKQHNIDEPAVRELMQKLLVVYISKIVKGD